MAITAANTSRLLTLPAELRDQIWAYTVIYDGPISPVRRLPWSRGGVKWPAQVNAEPAITRTSRQLRYETLQIYYAHNTFHLRCIGLNDAHQQAVRQWLHSLGNKARWLRKLALTGQIVDALEPGRLPVTVCYHLELKITTAHSIVAEALTRLDVVDPETSPVTIRASGRRRRTFAQLYIAEVLLRCLAQIRLERMADQQAVKDGVLHAGLDAGELWQPAHELMRALARCERTLLW